MALAALKQNILESQQELIEQERKFWHARSHRNILNCAHQQGLDTVIQQEEYY